MASSDDNLKKARKQIQQRIDAQEQARRVELQRRRLEIAGKGVASYNEKHLLEATLAFKTYISILEDLKGAPEGGLSPTHFDSKKDLHEMVLIAGVYWDLTKLFDRTANSEGYRNFQSYMSKYIAFTRGMPYQMMAAETLRKYIRSGRPKHKKDFNNAYKMMGGSRCFIATTLDEYADVDTLPRLRRFRDDVLKKNRIGRAFVAWYYLRGPKIAERISRFPVPLQRSMAWILDRIAWVVRADRKREPSERPFD
jgi:hypothetical protein